jgi:hypothetical protein
MGLPTFISKPLNAGIGALADRYTDDDDTISWTNVGKDALMASTAYAALNPNDSETLENFMNPQTQFGGYQGGVPNYTATRELLPNAFAQTNTDPTTQDVTARRPGSAGRQYFTDTTFAPDTIEPIMGKTAVEIAADNEQNLANQAIYESLMGDAFDARVASEAATAGGATAGGATVSDGILTANELASIATGKYFDNGDGTFSDAVGNIFNEVDGQLTVDQALTGEQLLARDGPANAPAAAAAATPLTLEESLLAYSSDYTANTDGTFTGPSGYVFDYIDGDLVNLGLSEDISVSNDIVDLLTAGERDSVNTGKYTDNGDGTFSDARGNIFNEVDGQLTVKQFYTGQQLIDQYNTSLEGQTNTPASSFTQFIDGFQDGQTFSAADAASVTANGFDIAEVAAELKLDPTDLQTFINDTATYNAAIATASNDLNTFISNNFTTGVSLTAADAEKIRASGLDIAKIAAELKLDPTALQTFVTSNTTITAAQGGQIEGQGYYLGGPTDGMADQIPATIDNMQPAALSDGEFVIPADIVSHLGNGNSEAGADNLYDMMERVRTDRTGNPNQGREIDPNEYLA